LINHILKTAKIRSWLGGNIGVAPFDFINKIKPTDWVVLELSSFQLEGMTISPKIAVIVNFTPEHLAPADPNNPNYHLSLNEYWLAKLNVARWQKKTDYLVINQKLKNKIAQHLPGGKSAVKINSKVKYFTKSALATELMGEHNKENNAAAVMVAKIMGIDQAIIERAIAKFKGLEHRLEFVRELSGVKYYNDTFATIPEATITALKAFDQPIVLLAGGADKNSDFKDLAKYIKKQVKFVVLLKGDATPRIETELLKVGFMQHNIKLAENIVAAVKTASQAASPGDVVLLSTACASFGMFKNYKERGRLFKEEVNKLK
jgi:UDP-N-acetylmuramoylalanine--D-glutamate ligase